MILAIDGRELRLQEEVVAFDEAVANLGRNRRTDAGFEVVTALIRGVDRTEAALDRQARQPFGLIFFPRGAVDERRSRHSADNDTL